MERTRKNSKGELTLDFINESELPLNCVYIQNLTGLLAAAKETVTDAK